MGYFLIVFWLQLWPINTHRPTQGINAMVVEKSALQIESGYQPFSIPAVSFMHEGILQGRYGIGAFWELFWTASGLLPSPKGASLSVALKRNFYRSAKLSLAIAGWGYLPMLGQSLGGQIWSLTDVTLSPNGTLSINFVGGYFETGAQGFLTAFYTHTWEGKTSAWGELFAYIPSSPGEAKNRYGFGAGVQRLLGKRRLTAVDIAANCSLDRRIQLMIGLSRKMQTFSLQSRKKSS
ncbi:MAG: hypothetical protein N2253_00365 [Bacteroidia bacterium]|nr:hypothetical protein [Bacteroidia bacterium]MCX7763331.1 hypothetical protein [Bacteroidia bacterium]MDW8057110.1 hypothetical protein [Bacteroidia bacterium]